MQLVGRRADRLHLAAVHRGLQVDPRREVPVQRADANAGPPGDVVERRVGAVLGEGGGRRLKELGAAAPRVRAHPRLFARVEAGLVSSAHQLTH